jgi:hypothetical protein
MIGPDFVIGFFGKRREGKTYAMRWILHNKRHMYPRGYVFTNTKINGFWQQMVPEAKVFNGYSPGIMDQITESQKALIEWMQKHPDQAQDVNPYIFIVMDDCISQDLHHAEQLKNVFYNGRHLKMFLLISLQFAKGIPPGFRENCDMAILFRQHSIAQVEAVCENFLGHWDKKTARKTLQESTWKDQCSGERQFLCVDMSGNVPIDDMLTVGQAQQVPDFITCCKEWWDGQEPKEQVKLA